MPTLRWLTRDEDIRAAEKVPYRLLEEVPDLSYGDPDTGNMLIQGDNLDALKALLPYYAGKVKCIYIDPPYNTGSAFEHYDDALEHSQWLAMMWPRLELLRELLSEDGSIWVSIDDREAHYLKVIMDEVFGRQTFISTVVWQSRYSISNDSNISLSHNYIYVYAKNPTNWKKVRNRLKRNKGQSAQYKNPDNDKRGPWRAIPWDAPNIRENLSYKIKTPSGKMRLPPKGRCWSRTEEQWLEIVESGLAYFGKKGDGAPSFKRYLSDAPGIVPSTWWEHEDAGHTDEAKKEMLLMFPEIGAFGTPKPERLVNRIVNIATNPGDLVLDSFLGSGTTAAVAQKMGRRFIGIEMGDHAVTHCQPRLQKVIVGEQGGISKAVDWQGGGGFRYYRLGTEIFDELGQLNPAIKFPVLAAHIWFSETHEPRPITKKRKNSPWLGVHKGHGFALLYNGILGDRSIGGGNVLTRATLKLIREDSGDFNGPLTIYGERSALAPATLDRENIIFKQTPYDVKARK